MQSPLKQSVNIARGGLAATIVVIVQISAQAYGYSQPRGLLAYNSCGADCRFHDEIFLPSSLVLKLNRAALGQRKVPAVEMVDEHVLASRVVAEGLDSID